MVFEFYGNIEGANWSDYRRKYHMHASEGIRAFEFTLFIYVQTRSFLNNTFYTKISCLR